MIAFDDRLTAADARESLLKYSDSTRAAHNVGFFKAFDGGYGEGDEFIGCNMPDLRSVARDYKALPRDETIELVQDPVHEVRLLGLIIWTLQIDKADQAQKQAIYDDYIARTKYINNWDLVDSSAPHIVGSFLYDRNRSTLYELAKSDLLWDRRIAILATFYFIKRDDYLDALAISEMLLGDKEDLMHKASGWMLREIGNRDKRAETEFLKKHYKYMPRTMLRYSIEKFPEDERQDYLNGRI